MQHYRAGSIIAPPPPPPVSNWQTSDRSRKRKRNRREEEEEEEMTQNRRQKKQISISDTFISGLLPYSLWNSLRCIFIYPATGEERGERKALNLSPFKKEPHAGFFWVCPAAEFGNFLADPNNELPKLLPEDKFVMAPAD